MAYRRKLDPAHRNSPGNTQLNTSSPARMAIVITPSDDTDQTVNGAFAKAYYVGTTGNITIIPIDAPTDTGVLFSNVPVGWFPVSGRRILATGTSASTIVAVV